MQAGYSGAAYLRALPDVGELLSAAAAGSGPQVNFPVAIETTGTYTVWVRAMAADGGSDSLHIGLDGQVVETSDNLTGFAPNEWDWSRLTLDSGNATLSLGSSGAYTLGLFMREDGIRVDKLLLITDTNYIPTGLGPAESQQQTVTATTPLTVVPCSGVVFPCKGALAGVPPCHFRQPGAYLDTFTYDCHGRINSHSRVINGRTTTMTVNEFDQLDRPVSKAYNFVGWTAASWVEKRPVSIAKAVVIIQP